MAHFLAIVGGGEDGRHTVEGGAGGLYVSIGGKDVGVCVHVKQIDGVDVVRVYRTAGYGDNENFHRLEEHVGKVCFFEASGPLPLDSDELSRPRADSRAADGD